MTSLGISTTSALQTENNEYSRQHVKVSQCKKSGGKNVDSIEILCISIPEGWNATPCIVVPVR